MAATCFAGQRNSQLVKVTLPMFCLWNPKDNPHCSSGCRTGAFWGFTPLLDRAISYCWSNNNWLVVATCFKHVEKYEVVSWDDDITHIPLIPWGNLIFSHAVLFISRDDTVDGPAKSCITASPKGWFFNPTKTMGSLLAGGFNQPLWKICVRQLGWWNSQYLEKNDVPNHQWDL